VMKSIEGVVGLDIGDRRIEVCVIAMDDARVLRREKLATDRAVLEAWFARQPRSRVVMETGTHAPWIARAAAASGHEASVLDARRVKLITESARKTDRRDAHMLARIGRSELDLACPVHVRSLRTQQVRGMMRMRDALVRSRSMVINAVRGVSKTEGLRLPACSAESFARQAREAMPELVRAMAEPLLEAIERLTKSIREYDRQLETIAEVEHGETTQRLQQVPGVGTLTALALVLAVEDPRRFRDGRQMASYLGLTPRIAQSGEADPKLGISKEGDRYARRLLVSAGHYVLERGPDTDLKRWGLALEARWGPRTRKRAAVAVARKLAVLLRRLWISGAAYEPLREAVKVA
jgi:transposase